MAHGIEDVIIGCGVHTRNQNVHKFCNGVQGHIFGVIKMCAKKTTACTGHPFQTAIVGQELAVSIQMNLINILQSWALSILTELIDEKNNNKKGCI